MSQKKTWLLSTFGWSASCRPGPGPGLAPVSSRRFNTLRNQPLRCIESIVIKRKPHHDLIAVKAKFARVETLEVTRSAVEGARALGYSLEDIVEAVQAPDLEDFVKLETAHSPRNSKVWHDTYNLPLDDRWLYLKFAGETLVDVTLTSFKETGND